MPHSPLSPAPLMALISTVSAWSSFVWAVAIKLMPNFLAVCIKKPYLNLLAAVSIESLSIFDNAAVSSLEHIIGMFKSFAVFSTYS